MEDSDEDDDIDISTLPKENISNTESDDLELRSFSHDGASTTSCDTVVMETQTNVVDGESGIARVLVETPDESPEVEVVIVDIEEISEPDDFIRTSMPGQPQDENLQPLVEDIGLTIGDCEGLIEIANIAVLTNDDNDEVAFIEINDDVGVISHDDDNEETLAETSDIEVVSLDDEDGEALQEIEDIAPLSNEDADEDANEDADEDERAISDDADELEENVGYLELYDDIDEGIEIVQATDDESDEDSSSSSEEGDAENKRTTFDTSLPTSHAYLGDDMEELHGRTIHPEGEIVIMPLFFQPGVVLAPGQTLPLNLFHPHPISMMKKVIAADKTFGMMMSKGSQSSEERNLFATIGVTCEIYSVREESIYDVEQMSLKCEGRQRFRILSKQFQMDGVILGKILILPDAPIPPYPKMSLIYSQHNRNAISGQVIGNKYFVKNNKWSFGEPRYLAGFNPRHKIVLCQSTAALPGWVYKLYNPYFLMDCLMNEIYSWNSNLNADTIPTDPTDFSHWITANLPLTNEMKIELLEIDSAILRLRRQIEFMNKCTTTLACIRCRAVITDKGELFSLSQKGPTSAYVNPGGHVHETVTFYKAKNLALQGRATTEYSWFPGYAWTVATCKSCHAHMGWKFSADKKGLQPSKFWGLTRAALKPVFKDVKDEKDDSDGDRSSPMFNEVMYESNI